MTRIVSTRFVLFYFAAFNTARHVDTCGVGRSRPVLAMRSLLEGAMGGAAYNGHHPPDGRLLNRPGAKEGSKTMSCAAQFCKCPSGVR